MVMGAGKFISQLSEPFSDLQETCFWRGSQAQGEVPRLYSGQQRRGCLNWPWPITILMNILHITIEPSSGDGWR